MIGSSGTLSVTGIGGPLGLSTDGMLYSGVGLVLTGIDVDHVGDDGGWPVVGYGIFPTTIRMKVWIVVPTLDPATPDMFPCYSGIQTQAFECTSVTGVSLPFVVPPLPLDPPPGFGLPFSLGIYIETVDGTLSTLLDDEPTVVHRTYTTNLYQTRASFPPPRLVGPYSTDEEDYRG